MQVPVQVTFRDMSVSDAIEARCWKEAEKLEQYFDRIIACRVAVAESHRRHQQGNLFEVRVDLTVPGQELVVNRVPPEHQVDEDVEVALREAFDRMRRRLQDYARKLRRKVKTHEGPPVGRVTRLLDGGFGFIETQDGREVYFHRNSVRGADFDDLDVGLDVSFGEEEGDKGPQAAWVTPLAPRAGGPPLTARPSLNQL